jgi:hypothetical protein
MGTVDSVLNFAVPAILILIVISFAWSKIIDPLLMPSLRKLWAYMNGEGEQSKHVKEIVYDGF